jgi:Zn-dependent peptidase ImmA (M78 family)
MLDVFFHYDGPKLFSSVNELGQQYIAVFVDEDADGTELYLYVPITDGRLGAVQGGRITLRMIFQQPETGHAYIVRHALNGGQTLATSISAHNIPTEWLPGERAVLPLRTNQDRHALSARLDVSVRFIIDRLRSAGVPLPVLAVLARTFTAKPSSLAVAATRIFGWSLSELIDSGTLRRPDTSTAAGYFKSQTNQSPALETYTMWAHWIALLVDQAVPRQPTEIPESSHAIREDVLASHHILRFENLLQWCWDQGIAVVPLGDPGVFHGAIWSVDGRVVIVLKQRTKWESRWTFDLAHELGHAARHLADSSSSVVELAEVNPLAPNVDEDEREASEFAAELLLGEPETMARELAERTARAMKRLKAQVQAVAANHGVEADALANYMAWRLELEGEDWWATAATLQEASGRAPTTARASLLARIDWARLSDDDAALLRAALDGSPGP